MKIRDYLLNQKFLIKNQIEKNNKLIKDFLSKTHQPFKFANNRAIIFSNPNKSSSLHQKSDKDIIIEQIKDENKYFNQLYSTTKKLYPTKVEETFKDLINLYQNNDYKIPDLSEKKNLFNQNPLLLVGRDLDHYFMYNDKSKMNSKKNKLNKKHVNFIQKEMIFMEKMIKKNSDINESKNRESSYGYDDMDYKPEKTNLFMVDSVWDKIKNQKKKQKQLLIYEKRKQIERKATLNKSSKNYNFDLSADKSIDKNDDSGKKKGNIIVNNYNLFNNYMKNKNYSKLNSINNLTSYNSQSSTNNNDSTIKKFRSNLLNLNLIKKIEENNKIQKEIEKIEKIAINKSLNRNKHKSIVEDMHSPSIFTKKFPFLIKYNKIEKDDSKDKEEEEDIINSDKSINKKGRRKTNIFRNNELENIKKLGIIERKTSQNITLNKLLKERNPQKYLESLSKVNLKTFNLNEIEILMKNYCEKVLGYKKKDIDKIVNVQKEGENVYQTIENIISKTKKKPLENYNNKKDIKRSLQEVNNSIFNLKRKFIFGKTNYIFE
jgi:hypothetical protein